MRDHRLSAEPTNDRGGWGAPVSDFQEVVAGSLPLLLEVEAVEAELDVVSVLTVEDPGAVLIRGVAIGASGGCDHTGCIRKHATTWLYCGGSFCRGGRCGLFQACALIVIRLVTGMHQWIKHHVSGASELVGRALTAVDEL